MAFIYHDYIGPLISNFRRNSSIFQRFRKRWNSTGEYYDERTYFYQAGAIIKDTGMKRFLSSIGMSYDDIESNDYDEVESCWFWLNQNRQAEEVAAKAMATSNISEVLNSKLTIGDRVRVTLNYGGSTQFYINEHKEEWGINNVGEVESHGINSEEIFEKIHSEPWKYIANIIDKLEDRATNQFHKYDSGRVDIHTNITPKGVGSRSSTPVATTTIEKLNSSFSDSSEIEFFALALLDDARVCFEPTLNDDGDVKVFRSGSKSYIRRKEEGLEELFDINGNLIIYDKADIKDFSLVGAASCYYEQYEFTYKGSNPQSKLIEDIKTQMAYLYIRDKRENNIMNTLQKQLMNRLHVETVGSEIKAVSGKWSEYFYGNRLIKEKVDNMKRYEFVNLLSDCLDTGFKAKDASFFEKLFTAIIIIVAVVVTIFTAGVLAPASATLASFALGLGYASLVLTIGGLVLSQMGLSAQGLVKVIGRVAQIVGLVASITGLMAAAQSAFNRAAEAALKKGTIKQVADYTIKAFAEDAIQNVIDSVMDKITSVFEVLSSPMDMLDGGISGALDKLDGFMSTMKKGMEMHQRFMNSSADTNTTPEPTEEQLSKTNFQHPEQMFQLQEQMVYEQDALMKMSAMKENQFGLARTEKLLDQIA